VSYKGQHVIVLWQKQSKKFALFGQSVAFIELLWNRRTIRKGIREIKSGIICVDNYSTRGRQKIEAHLPQLLEDITALVDSQSQTDPSFKSARLYTRLSATSVRRQLIEKKVIQMTSYQPWTQCV
jgi:hypothetical protein